MKATIDVPEEIYRKVKAKSAIEGRAVRDVAITLFRAWVEQPSPPLASSPANPTVVDELPAPPWFASLRKYAHNARGRHDMASVRRSIARGRTGEAHPS